MKPKLKERTQNTGKRIVAHPSGDSDALPPKFCLRHMRNDYCLKDCTKEQKAAFADKLFELSRCTWSQLRQADRHGLGYEKIERNSVRAEIPPSVTDDVALIAFRFYGKAPMVGYRSKDGVFNILWLDSNFKLYPH